ncbi:FkbM family methyltransferase [Pedobacter jejuensis]|uniref:FkbM family methyltransferase n=1 Tax=Pedobacter jejuensis TaxID=1268550 RepID=A0A3N0BTZ4_9SPHI|nr:FkbM family methyltransferase [Pedobacter jejuensis]RNL52569.1 FkbM family methyltransferase [Pedobacter jejuensis]
MAALKETLKKIIKFHPYSHVKPLQNLIHVGSEHHGYTIPNNYLDKNSICYCIGAGEDISFDTELKVLFDSNVFIFDPMPEGINYFKKLKNTLEKGETFGVFDDKNFLYRLNSKQINEITYVNKGVWNEKTTLKFYAPQLDNYISHSVYLFQDSDDYIEAPVDKLKNFMQEFGHMSVDLVKIEIEGAEYTVIDSIIKDKLDIKIICIEFDEVYHKKDLAHKLRIRKSSNQLLKAGYVMVHSTYMMKRTFVRKDVYDFLKSKE